MRSTENKLILLKPGEYLRAGGEGAAVMKLNDSVQGLVIKKTEDPHKQDDLLTVLVNGQLINVWSREKCDK
tara:strand:+ start:2401 stop:2613 length:213 start_codon:yes stop_codon:yes gene_type:complete